MELYNGSDGTEQLLWSLVTWYTFQRNKASRGFSETAQLFVNIEFYMILHEFTWQFVADQAERRY